MTKASRLKVFVVNSMDDKQVADELRKKMSSERWLNVWSSEYILPGEKWEDEVEKHIEKADITIVCLSRASIKKEGESHHILNLALDRVNYKPDDKIFIIPVRFDDCEIPRKLRLWRSADYFGATKDHDYKKMLQSMEKDFTMIYPDVDLKTVKFDTAPKNQPSPVIPPEPNKVTEEPKPTEKNPPKEPKNIAWKTMVAAIIAVVAVFGLMFYFVSLSNNETTDVLPATSVVSAETAIDTPKFGDSQISAEDEMTLLYVPSGSFLMGSPVQSDEMPVESVSVASFWIDRTEVSYAMYNDCIVAGKCGARDIDPALVNHPVVNVTWNEALAYCIYAGRRLPTEAEWEKAARGIDNRTYPWGFDDPNANLLNFKNSLVGATKPVDSYANGKSPYGAYNMAGNVWEWTFSLYTDSYPYNAPAINDPSSNEPRSIRGGSWSDVAENVRASDRYRASPSTASDNLGFRCAQNN